MILSPRRTFATPEQYLAHVLHEDEQRRQPEDPATIPETAILLREAPDIARKWGMVPAREFRVQFGIEPPTPYPVEVRRRWLQTMKDDPGLSAAMGQLTRGVSE